MLVLARDYDELIEHGLRGNEFAELRLFKGVRHSIVHILPGADENPDYNTLAILPRYSDMLSDAAYGQLVDYVLNRIATGGE